MRKTVSATWVIGSMLLGGITATPDKLAAAQAQALPAAMIGTWGWEASSCIRANDDGRLIVRAKALEFFASLFELQTIALLPDGSVRANATYREEGDEKSSGAEVRLRIASPNGLMVQTGSLDEGHIYVRCNS